MGSVSKKSLIERLRRGKKTRDRLVESNLAETIAFQIRATRNTCGWTQAELAQETGMTQNNISRMESPEYGKYSIASLRRIAAAFDVALEVRFVPFSQYIHWLSGTEYQDKGLRPEAMAVKDFESEEASGVYDAAPVTYYGIISPQLSSGGSSMTLTPRTEATPIDAPRFNGNFQPSSIPCESGAA